jgi:hypothetical protein
MDLRLENTIVARRKYSAPKSRVLNPDVLHEFQKEASAEDTAAAQRLRPLYLWNERTDLTPIAARFVIPGDQRRTDWQRVFQCRRPQTESELLEAESELYFLGSLPHGCDFKVELQMLCPDAKTRIAVVNEVAIPSDKKSGFVVLPRKQGVASAARST